MPRTDTLEIKEYQMPSSPRVEVSVLETSFGWFGLLGFDGRLRMVQIGHPTKAHTIENMTSIAHLEAGVKDIRICNWHPELQNRLRHYAEGNLVDFSDIALAWQKPLTPFRQKVIAATRRIPIGLTLTYAQLAAKSGSPGAARAVGNTMATNPFPIIVPCHRVIASNGGLGGFSAPTGIDLKQRLLQMEREIAGK